MTATQFIANRQETQFYLTESAKAEGRVQGRITAQAYDYLHAKLSEMDYPTPEQRMQFWLDAERMVIEDDGAYELHREATNGNSEARYNLLDVARAAVNSKATWTSGERVELWSNGRWSASLVEGGRDGGGMLYLSISNGNGQRHAALAGLLLSGWTWTMTDAAYEQWARKARKMVGIS